MDAPIPAPAASAAPSAPSSRPVRRIRRRRNQVPEIIRSDPALAAAVAHLPHNYAFEVPKTIWKCREAQARHVGLQMPEGLLMYACVLSDIVRRFGGPQLRQVSILGDVTYGACCIEDLSAEALGVDFLVHYGHSCLVPVQDTAVRVLYVFVEIRFDVTHALASLGETFPGPSVAAALPDWLRRKDDAAGAVALEHEGHRPEPPSAAAKIAVLGTVQFASAVQEVAARLQDAGRLGGLEIREVFVPQALPLSPGETLGCTAPTLAADTTLLLFLADGRFHLEAAMIANPTVPALRYDPYGKSLTWEGYDHSAMKAERASAIATAREAKRWGVILGTLGRQGNPAILGHVRRRLRELSKAHVVILLSEIFPSKLKLFTDIDAFVQIACPRLSVDWGTYFHKPVLNPFEFEVATGGSAWRSDADVYPMDYYRKGSGKWTNYAHEGRDLSDRMAAVTAEGTAIAANARI